MEARIVIRAVTFERRFFQASHPTRVLAFRMPQAEPTDRENNPREPLILDTK